MGGIVFVASHCCARCQLRVHAFLALHLPRGRLRGDRLHRRLSRHSRGPIAGLSARTKLLATALIAVIFLRDIAARPVFFRATCSFTPERYGWWPALAVVALGILAITGTIHAVNLTDGLDGLAAGTMVPPLIVLALIAIGARRRPRQAIACAIGIGALLGLFALQSSSGKDVHGRYRIARARRAALRNGDFDR